MRAQSQQYCSLATEAAAVCSTSGSMACLGAWQQPDFNLSTSYLYHATQCIQYCLLCVLVMPPHGISTVLLQPCNVLTWRHKRLAPIPSDRWRYNCNNLSLCMFSHVNDNMPVYASNSRCCRKCAMCSGIWCNSHCRWTWLKPALPMPSRIRVGYSTSNALILACYSCLTTI